MARKPDSLNTYRRKRDFAKTTEPAGEVVRDREGWSFVVHKHDASHLHYDLRLELDGVLKSWAVPKGPSYDPADRRLAVQVEDHPLDYGGFEGVIPAGEYGGGTVMLWDRGTWTPEGDPRAGLAKGKLVVTFHGEKLRGTWHLARMGGKAAGKPDKPNWLLIKGKDDTAQPGLDPDDGEARSVLSGRTMAEIAAAADRVWSGETGEVTTAAPADLPRARKAAFPRDLAPQLATLAREIPAGEGWLHEIKFDGYRLLAHVKNHRVKLVTRGGKDWTRKFPRLAEAFASLPVDAVVDGEATVVDAAGRTDFQALQNVLETGRGKDVVFFAFDLLHLDGYDLTRVPLADRKRALASLLAASPAENGALRFSDHLEGGGEAVHEQACRLGLEGIIAKRADAPYEQRRTRSWLKIKCGRRQEFVIGGYLASENRQGLRSLLLGVHQDDALIYAGKVGTGFDQSSLVALAHKLDQRAVKTPPFADAASIREKGVHWARPDLVCEIEFTEWTADGHLRHPSFKGLRADKDPAEVVREVPRAMNQPTAKKKTQNAATTAPLDHPPRPRPLPRGRPHQGPARRLLRRDRRPPPAPRRGPPPHPGALSRGPPQAVLLPEAPPRRPAGQREGGDGAREGRPGRLPHHRRPRRPPRPGPDRRARAAPLGLAQRRPRAPRPPVLRPRPRPRRRAGRRRRRRPAPPRPARRPRPDLLRQDLRRQGLPRRRPHRPPRRLGPAQGLHQGHRRRPRPHRTAPLRLGDDQGETRGQDLPRLPAQRPRRDQRRHLLRRGRAPARR